jgi:hypothetical protein
VYCHRLGDAGWPRQPSRCLGQRVLNNTCMFVVIISMHTYCVSENTGGRDDILCVCVRVRVRVLVCNEITEGR